VKTIKIINPLGGALDHYVKALEDILESADISTTLVSIVEPSVSGGQRVDYLRTLVRERLTNLEQDACIVTWPTFGYLDPLMVPILRRPRVWTVVHDVRPLVTSVGYGRTTIKWASRFHGRAPLIAHSRRAASELAALGFANVARLPLPISNAIVPRPAEQTTTDGTIRVLGQYKRSRSLGALAEIAACKELREHPKEIVGRGWPAISGWRVQSEFIPESVFANKVAQSSAIVIPYSNFYQSEVALRALENDVPVVGPCGTHVEEVYGSTWPGLVRDDWGGPLTNVLRLTTEDVAVRRRRYRRAVAGDWRGWVEGLG